MRRYSDLKALPTDAEHEKEAIQEENRGHVNKQQFHELNLKGGQMEKSDLRVKQVSFSPPPVKEKKKKEKKKKSSACKLTTSQQFFLVPEGNGKLNRKSNLLFT